MRKIICFLLFLFCTGILFAETVYIAQGPEVIMFNAPDPSASILMKLSKNTPVELLQTDEAKGFALVKTDKGEKGWVQTKFLSSSQQKTKPSFLVKWWHHITGNTVARKLDKDQTANEQLVGKTAITGMYSNAIMQSVNSQAILDLEKQVQKLQQQVQQLDLQVFELKQKQSQGQWRLTSIAIVILGFIVLIWLIKIFSNKKPPRMFK